MQNLNGKCRLSRYPFIRPMGFLNEQYTSSKTNSQTTGGMPLEGVNLFSPEILYAVSNIPFHHLSGFIFSSASKDGGKNGWAEGKKAALCQPVNTGKTSLKVANGFWMPSSVPR